MTVLPEDHTKTVEPAEPEDVAIAPDVPSVEAVSEEPAQAAGAAGSPPPAELDDLRADLEAEWVRVAERAAALGPLLERASTHRDELEALRASVVEKDHEIDELRADLAAARAQVAFERERLGGEIDRIRAQTADEREHIVATKERLRVEIERLRRDRVWLNGELEELAAERRRLEVLSASLDDLHVRLQADRARVIEDLARLGSYPTPLTADVADDDDDVDVDDASR